ncbi:MAG: ATP-dependent 6-phosphofructokinase [Alphaproteobacteria bacterium]|nr:ATP-dependent 6-phosphofructokinase [Alphaproteobacteria bacterium]MBN2779575.1 ATP-dependent 6-phosphofructokinase [Alphaproteobacteria bacterium]
MRIGVMTAGGDCAGLNVVLKTLVRGAAYRGWDIIGIKNAAHGLVQNPIDSIDLTTETFPQFIDMVSGTFLGSNLRKLSDANIADWSPYKGKYIVVNADRSFVVLDDVFEKQIKKLKLDALILTGGDDSLQKIAKLCLPINLPVIGIPKTIDNDIKSIDRSIGFDTGIQEVVHLLDNLRTTAYSHHRIMVLETMGNSSGHLAMHGGVAGGVDAIIVPEFNYSKDNLIKHIQTILNTEKRFSGLIVVSEGVKPKDPAFKSASKEIVSWLENASISSRAMVAGHFQRGGKPSVYDRVLALRLANHALDMLDQKKPNCMVSIRNDKLISIPIKDLETDSTRLLKKSDTIVQAAQSAGIYVGD